MRLPISVTVIPATASEAGEPPTTVSAFAACDLRGDPCPESSGELAELQGGSRPVCVIAQLVDRFHLLDSLCAKPVEEIGHIGAGDTDSFDVASSGDRPSGGDRLNDGSPVSDGACGSTPSSGAKRSVPGSRPVTQ